MKRKTVWTLCLAAALFLSLVALGRAVGPANPTLTEKRFQAIQLAATTVDLFPNRHPFPFRKGR